MDRPSPSSPAAKETYRKALQKVEAVHGNMAVLGRLGSILREPDHGIDEIARFLQTDGALCANIIRIGNSAYYGAGSRSTGIEASLAKVGYNRVLSLVGASLSRRLFMNDLNAYGISANEYWAGSYFCAVILEQHAFRLGQSADDAYLLGLLHSIGRVVINDLLARTKIEVYWDRSLPCEEWEDILVGFRHDEAGAEVLRGWKFSPAVHERVARQRSPTAQADDPLLLLLDFAQACVALNHARLRDHPWRLPETHPWLLRPDSDPAQTSLDVETAKKVCLQVEEAIRVA
jgi:HD-like signal output (HDOD) protein